MSSTKDLTKGAIKSQLIALTFPLIVGNILQQFYNTMDSFIVGRYVGHSAFAAVGVAGSIMNLFIFVLNGACNGISIIFAQLYGQKKWERLKRESFVSLLLGGIFTLGLSALSMFFLKPLVFAIQTPKNVRPYVFDYLWIILAGLLITFLYNWCSSALRAAGDTKTPLWTLIISMVLNLILDFIFVVFFKMGTAGTATATVLAQLISFICCLFMMRKKCPIFFFGTKDMKFDKVLIKKTANYGIVSALQQSSIYIGKLLVQGAVNTGGTDMISAYTATMRIEGFTNSFGDSGAAALSVFVAQNDGAGQKERAKKGFKEGMILLCLSSVILGILMILFTKEFVILLMGNPSEAVMQNAVMYMNIISVFYILCFIGSAYVGFFRGVGMVAVPVIGSTLQIAIRAVLSYIMISRFGLSAVAIATGIGWIAIVIFHTFIYRRKKY